MTIILVMTTPRSIADAKAHLAEYIATAETGEPVVLTRHGKPVAALVSIADLERLERQRDDDPQAGLAGLMDAWDADPEGEAEFETAIDAVIASRSAGRPLPNLAD